jgi:hypothetical protein
LLGADGCCRYADGTQTPDNSTYGMWMVMNTKDTYYGGPLHSDLVVDGIVYNYMSSNHHGNQVVSWPVLKGMSCGQTTD